MKTKRTLNDALQTEWGPEARAFLDAGSPQAQPVPPALATATSEARQSVTPSASFETEAVEYPAPPTGTSQSAITVRLPAELPAALLRVAFERRLKRQRPFTQQEIVAEALRDWLERHGWRNPEKG